MKYTLLKRPRRQFLKGIGDRVSGLRGDFVELGTWRGGSAKIVMESLLESHLENVPHCWLFDSFTGMPDPTEHDRIIDGKHASEYKHLGMPDDDSKTYDICCKYLSHVDYPKTHLHIIKGMFEDTFPVYENEISEISILHVDCDWYDSVKQSLNTFYDKTVIGGYIILDDYGTWDGARKAVDEFLLNRGLDNKILNRIDKTGYWFEKR